MAAQELSQASAHPDDSERLNDLFRSCFAPSGTAVRDRSCDYANVMGVIAGFLARFNPLRTNRDRSDVGMFTGTDIEDRKQS